jgi:hypothetical protein
MTANTLFKLGILGTSLFILASIIGAFQFENYSHISQLISETYAIDTPYGKPLRFLAFLPSGLLLTIFAFAAKPFFPKSTLISMGFSGIGIFYGMATIVVSIFPCDHGCNKELIDVSISQLIHNLTGLLTYLFVPFSILAIGVGLRQLRIHPSLSAVAIICGIVSAVGVGILFSDPLSPLAGLHQRIVEGTFLFWFVACSFFIKNQKSEVLPA